MPNQTLTSRAPSENRKATIVDGQTVSSAIDKRGYPIVGLRFNLVDASSLTFSVCDTATGTFDTVKDSAGNTVTLGPYTAARHALKAEDLAFLAPYNFFKVTATVAQGTGTTGATILADLMA